MAILRTENEINHNQYVISKDWGGDDTEWEDCSRVDEDAWIQRYNHEAIIINKIIVENNYSKILELGAGVGKLSDVVRSKCKIDLNYTLIDKPFGKKQFEKNKFKGNFFVKDLNNNFDISDIGENYDLVIANDFLEHIANPSDCLVKCYDITHSNSRFLVSVPNWRMGHTFIYRGIFDYDNWVYTMFIHGWEVESVYGSPLVCNYHKKLSSEETLPDNMIQSWNWYFVAKRR